MGMHVFTYGSLMFEPIWSKVVSGKYEKTEARLSGYKRLKIKDEVYPALLPGADTDSVEGIVYRNVSFGDLKRIEEFEGQYYRREITACRLPDGSTLIACVYVLDGRFNNLVEDELWEPEWFEKVGIQIFLEKYGKSGNARF